MSDKKTLQVLRIYKRPSHMMAKKRYLGTFLPKMVYRTTKTENPTASRRLVQKVLKDLS